MLWIQSPTYPFFLPKPQLSHLHHEKKNRRQTQSKTAFNTLQETHFMPRNIKLRI